MIWPTPSTTRGRRTSTNLWGLPRGQIAPLPRLHRACVDPERAAVIAQIQAGQFQLGADVAPGLAMLNTKYMLVPGPSSLPFAGGLGASLVRGRRDMGRQCGGRNCRNCGTQPSGPSCGAHRISRNPGPCERPGCQRGGWRPTTSPATKVNSQRGGLLVLSEVHYPVGWTATVDGEEVPLVRVNYILSGLNVPAGARRAVDVQARGVGHSQDAQPRRKFVARRALGSVDPLRQQGVGRLNITESKQFTNARWRD